MLGKREAYSPKWWFSGTSKWYNPLKKYHLKQIQAKVTLPETNSSPLKMDGWNTTFLLGFGLFSGAFAVGFREGTILVLNCNLHFWVDFFAGMVWKLGGGWSQIDEFTFLDSMPWRRDFQQITLVISSFQKKGINLGICACCAGKTTRIWSFTWFLTYTNSSHLSWMESLYKYMKYVHNIYHIYTWATDSNSKSPLRYQIYSLHMFASFWIFSGTLPPIIMEV